MLLHGLDRLVGQRLALVAGQVHLDVDGLAVVALRAGGGQRVAPEVLDVLDVLGVGLELARSARRSTRAASSPSGCSPSSTIIAELSESNSSKTWPMRFIAIIDGASSGLIDTARIWPTVFQLRARRR